MEEFLAGEFFSKKRDHKLFLEQLLKSIPFFSDIEGDIINLHSARVAILAYHFSSSGIESNKTILFLSGLYHDIGAVGSSIHPVRVLSLADFFTDPWLSTHPIRSAQVLRKVHSLKPSSNIVLEHHEWFNGGGFPFKKKNLEIMPEAQALRVIDAFDIAMLLTGKTNAAIKIVERTSSKEYDEDLFFIFKHLVINGDFEYLWFEPEKTVEEALSILNNLKLPVADNEILSMLRVFDLKKYPINGHTRRVKDMVALVGAEIGSLSIDSMIKGAYLHEIYTLYEPYKGSYLGSMSKEDVLSRFDFVYDSLVELQTDSFLNEIINTACYLDKKLYPNFFEMGRKEVIEHLTSMSGRVNPEVLLAFKKVIDEYGENIFKEKALGEKLS